MTRPALFPLRLALLVVAVAGLGFVALACADDDSQPVSPTPIASATPPTPAEPSQTATSAPSPTAAASSDEAVIQPALDAISANDDAALRALVRYTQVPCMIEPAGGFPQPPKCPTGTPDGTAIDVFPVSSGEGHYLLTSEMDEFFAYGRGGAIYGVYKSPAAVGASDFPQGLYGVIVDQPSKQEAERTTLFGLDADGEIVHWRVGLGATPEQLARQRPAGSAWVIPPAN